MIITIMKYPYFTLFCLLGLLCGCGPSDNLRIRAHFIDRPELNEKMAYLFAGKRNRMKLLDSCRIEEGECRFSAFIDEYYDGEIIVEPGYMFMLYALSPNDRIDITYRKGRGMVPLTVSGSPDIALQIRMSELNRQRIIRSKILQDSLWRTSDPRKQQLMRDSIEYYDGVYVTKIFGDAAIAQNNPYVAATNRYLMMKMGTDSVYAAFVTDSLRRKFPHSEDVRMELENDIEKIRYSTHEDTLAHNFRRKIAGLPPLQPLSDRRIAKPAEGIEAYKTGDKVADFALPGLDGTDASLAQCKAPYVLLDIWATWCMPCLKEIPHIVEAKRKYGDLLDVYALSLDYYADTWRNYIAEHGLDDFVHALVTNDDPRKPEVLARFGAVAIPHNFLLDAERRIVAVDLRGDALDRKMRELTGK